MSDIRDIKTARRYAYNVFEQTGKIEDYKTYKNLDNLIKEREKENETHNLQMQ